MINRRNTLKASFKPPEGAMLWNRIKDFFRINKLGGHREFALALGNPSRACPGYYGLEIAEKMRNTHGIGSP